MIDMQADIVNLITSFFGEETGNLVGKISEGQSPQELIKVAEDMLSKLLGPENSKKQLQPIYNKYGSLLKKG